MEEDPYQSYNLFLDRIYMREGRLPGNDYEMIVNISDKDEFPINKETTKTINDRKMKVVGYYDSAYNIRKYLVNDNMINYLIITAGKNLVVSASDKEKVIAAYQELGLDIRDSYENSKEQYKKSRENTTKATLISSLVVLAISLIEIILMLRSSFLSRIKEVGIYRAIGLKKKDIYIMFSGEIIAITTLAAIPGILLSAYVFKTISTISFLSREFIVNPIIILTAIIIVFVFNLFFGLLPVMNTLRKRPAQILARTDI